MWTIDGGGFVRMMRGMSHVTDETLGAVRDLLALAEQPANEGRAFVEAAILRLAAEIVAYGPDGAWPRAANALAGTGGTPNYYDSACRIVAPLRRSKTA